MEEEQIQLLAQDIEEGRQNTATKQDEIHKEGRFANSIDTDDDDITVSATLGGDSSIIADYNEALYITQSQLVEKIEKYHLLLLQKDNEQLKNDLFDIKENNKKVNEEMHKMQIIVGQLTEAQTPTQTPYYAGARSPVSKIFLRNMKTAGMPEDTFTLMMISNPRSYKRAMCLGTFAFFIQMTLSIMIASNQIGESKYSSLFNVPFKVDPVVRVGQFIGILFCSATQNDVMTSIHSLVLFRKSSRWYEALHDGIDVGDAPSGTMEWSTFIVLPNLMKLIEGLIVLFVSFVIIVQSDNIIDLFKVRSKPPS